MNIRLEGVTYEAVRGNEVKNCLHSFDAIIHAGEFHCITGVSGSGKSTLLNILTGMLKPTSGVVYWDEKDCFQEIKEEARTSFRNHKLGYMMQDASLLGNLNIFENMICPYEISGKKIDNNKVEKILKKLELWHIKNSYPTQISGGEYKRASLARAMIVEPDIVVADEPTSNLDKKSAALVYSILHEYNKKGTTIITATHDEQFLIGNKIVYKL